MRIFCTMFLTRLSIATIFLIGLLPVSVATAAQNPETSHENPEYGVTIEWTDAWVAEIPADAEGTIVVLDQASTINLFVVMFDSASLPPEDGVWLFYDDTSEILEDNSTDATPSASWTVEGTGIVQYAESYTVNDGDTTMIVSFQSVPVMQSTAIELIQSEVTINGQPPLTGAILGNTGDPDDLTGVATPEGESRTSRTTRGTSETPEATGEATAETTRTSRTTRGSDQTPEATETADATEVSRTTRGSSETPETTDPTEEPEDTSVVTRTPRTGSGTVTDQDATPEPTEESSLSLQPDTFTSTVYGFSINWNPNVWQMADTVETGSVDGVRLDGESGTVFFIGTAQYGSDPVGCLIGEEEYYGTSSDQISNWEAAIGADGQPLRQESDDLAWGVFRYTFTSSSGSEVEFVDYISCETIPGQDAVLMVQLTSLPDQYNDNLDAVLDILDTLEFQP